MLPNKINAKINYQTPNISENTDYSSDSKWPKVLLLSSEFGIFFVVNKICNKFFLPFFYWIIVAIDFLRIIGILMEIRGIILIQFRTVSICIWFGWWIAFNASLLGFKLLSSNANYVSMVEVAKTFLRYWYWYSENIRVSRMSPSLLKWNGWG